MIDPASGVEDVLACSLWSSQGPVDSVRTTNGARVARQSTSAPGVAPACRPRPSKPHVDFAVYSSTASPEGSTSATSGATLISLGGRRSALTKMHTMRPWHPSAIRFRRKLAVVAVVVLGTLPGGCASGAVPSAGGTGAAPTTSTLTSTAASPTTIIASPNGTASPSDVPRSAWEGGPSYYRDFPQATAAGWADPSFFPIGVWFAAVRSQEDVDLDKTAGLNTYVELTDNSDITLVYQNGMFAIPSGISYAGQGSETVGWLLEDEADMFGGPGNGEWTGNHSGEGPICSPEDAQCGYTVMRTRAASHPSDGRLRYANYGKGVFMWETDAEAEPFVNAYTDIVSTDIYWYTDPGICEEAANFVGIPMRQCRLAANYGAVIDRERDLDARDGRRQPIYAFVEAGAPFDSGGAITANQLAGAVMSSLIHEARGIIYFSQSFGGSCITQHLLRDSCGVAARSAVTKINGQIKQLAPVLNEQSYQYIFNPGLDTMIKEHDGSYYVFTMLKRGTSPGSHTLTLPSWMGGSKAEVLFENRTVPVSVTYQLTDTLSAECSYHIYKITP